MGGYSCQCTPMLSITSAWQLSLSVHLSPSLPSLPPSLSPLSPSSSPSLPWMFSSHGSKLIQCAEEAKSANK